jgi:hypothetical protein
VAQSRHVRFFNRRNTLNFCEHTRQDRRTEPPSQVFEQTRI